MRDDELPPSLEDAVDILRNAPEPRAEWTSSLLDATSRQSFETVAPRRWSFRPSMAIAASIAFIALGAAATYSLMSRRVERPPVAVAAAGEQQVRFTLVAPNAAKVTLVGDFNGWNASDLPMRRSANGQTWEVEVGLAPGRYTYSFVVDGHLARDPAAAETAHDDFGAPNSVLLVKGS
jgi:hypothetical protein